MSEYWLRSYPAEAARALWREDINAGRIFFGHTSYLRSSIEQERLNSLAILSIEAELMMRLGYDDIIDDFAAKKYRHKPHVYY